MPYRQPPNRGDDLSRLRPPTVTEAEKPLRRAVAMAYRTVREAGRSHHDALDAAEAVYFQACPETFGRRLQPSHRRMPTRSHRLALSGVFRWQVSVRHAEFCAEAGC